MSRLPESMTLADWARRLADRHPHSAARELALLPADQQERLLHAHRLLASGEAYGETARALSAEELAAYCEGELAAVDAQRIEQVCWQSPSQLAELFSVARMIEGPGEASVSTALEARLLALDPQDSCVRQQAAPPKFRLAPRDRRRPDEIPFPPQPPEERRKHDRCEAVNGHAVVAMATPDAATNLATKERTSGKRPWWLVAAAVLLTVGLGGATGWMAATWSASRAVPEMARRRTAAEQPKEAGAASGGVEEPVVAAGEQLPFEPPESRQFKTPYEQPEPVVAAAGKRQQLAASEQLTPVEARPATAHATAGPPAERVTTELSIASTQGLLLSDVGLRGKWRVADERHDLSLPLRVLSLTESWTRVELPGVATLIFEGDTEATLAKQADGTVEVRIVHGRLGVEDLHSGGTLRLVCGDAACTARGVAERSTLAMVRDPASSGLLVPEGAVAVDHLEIRQGQVVRWHEGLPQVEGRVSYEAQGSLHMATPPLIDPWDLAWLAPPTEFAVEQWNTTFGPLTERLVKADDVGVELIKLADDLREPRQAALAGRWSVAANPSERSNRVWNMLTDRRAAVRASAMSCLLDAPPGDARASELSRMLEERLGTVLTGRIDKWLEAAWQPGPLAVGQASEVVEHLQHSKLAVRHIAVSMLQLHTAGALEALGLRQPAYDPTARPALRSVGYAEWRAVMAQLYAPNRKLPMQPGAAQPGAIQPQRQRALLNGAAGGT